MSTFTIQQESVAGGPPISFEFDGSLCHAALAGATLTADASVGNGERANLNVVDALGAVLADVMVRKVDTDQSITESVVRIGSALLWSHARYVAVITPGDDTCICTDVPSRHLNEDGHLTQCPESTLKDAQGDTMRFNPHSDETACGKAIPNSGYEDLGGLACMRTCGHLGDCIPEANKAGEADGVRWCCRVPLTELHAQWCDVSPDTERCVNCRIVLIQCDCQPGCPGGKCPVCQ